jgi:hypothetical protein
VQVWIFQANPKLYDIDSALLELKEIWWRVPQYTADIHTGDIALIWRSGAQAGFVGIGRIVTEPQQHVSPDLESRYVLAPEIAGVETRVLVQVRASTFIPKLEVADLEGLADHPIIVAPMGSVFSLDYELYLKLRSRFPEPPEASVTTDISEIPTPFAWEQRSKSAHPMPGGYDGYLHSLRTIAVRVLEERPTRAELAGVIASEFQVTEKRSDLLASFLRKAGFLIDRGEIVAPSDRLEAWLASGDDRIPIAMLHSRVRFVGEMLECTLEPMTTGEILDVANEKYGSGWSTKAQIDRRRGWLQSAGMLEVDEANRLVTTPEGQALLELLDPYRPAKAAVPPEPLASTEVEAPADGPAKSSEPPLGLESLFKELEVAALDSAKADRFERAVRDAFEWLGFQAEWLGGAGKTDVLLDAPLGLSHSYRVIIDCKTSASGSVHDPQIDWVTLGEHKAKHDADHIALVAPQPSGKRLFQRAQEHGVTVFSVDELITLCAQHAKAPLDLESYRRLFEEGGLVSTDDTAEKAEDWLRVVELARTILDTIALRSEKFGSLDASGLRLLLADEVIAETATKQDFQDVLDTLSGPLIAVLTGNSSEGYRLTTSPATARHRLDVLGRSLFGSPSRPDGWSYVEDGS